MNRKIIILSIVLLLVGLFFLTNNHLSNKNGDGSPKQNTSDSIGHKGQGQQDIEISYFCPMHPKMTSTQEGQSCPICGMDLVLNEGEKDRSVKNDDFPTGRAPIELSSYRKQMIGLKLGKVERKALFKTIKAPGRAAFDPELYTAQAEYQQALRQFERVKTSSLNSVKKNVQRMLDSAKVRLKVLGLSDNQIDAVQTSTDISESLLIYKKGGQIWIYADIFEMDLRNIKPGQSVKMTASYLEGVILVGVVASTDQVINPKTRTAKVRIQIKNSPIKIRPESYLDVSIYVPQGEHLAIPYDAIVDTGEETFVFVNQGEGKIVPRKVHIKFRAGEQVAISEGLKEGDDIVVSGNFLVDSESQLKATLSDMSESDSKTN
jgi:membrane fusion protein, copper/silver efflux system